jgi:hypothetical protein
MDPFPPTMADLARMELDQALLSFGHKARQGRKPLGPQQQPARPAAAAMHSTKQSREHAPAEHLLMAEARGQEQAKLRALIEDLRLQGLSGEEIASAIRADRDPASMQATTFLMWLDEASVNTLEAFGRGEPFDTEVIYDPFVRLYVDYRTSIRWDPT